MPVALITHPDSGRHDTGWAHPEHVGRLRSLPRALRHDVDLFHAIEHREARHASEAELGLGHDATYIARVRASAEVGGTRFDPDTVTSSGSWDAATSAVGAVLDGIDQAFAGRSSRAFCAVRPPGHHALRDRAMGFCLFGNVAIGACYARLYHHAGRVLIADWDVHHGNGTQALVQNEPNIHFVSMHQWPWYPGTGAADDRGPHQSIWNVPLAPGLAREVYLAEFNRAIDAATRSWVPDIILLSAGFDCLRGDPLGGFTLELDDIAVLTRGLVERAESWCRGRLVSALEGGYDPDRVGAACVTHLRALL